MIEHYLKRPTIQRAQHGGRLIRRVGRATIRWSIIALLLSAFGIAMVYSAGQTDVPIAYVAGAWKRQLAWFARRARGGVLRRHARVGAARSSGLTLPVYLLGIVLLVVTLRLRLGRRHGGEHEGLADDRRRAARPAGGAREARPWC